MKLKDCIHCGKHITESQVEKDATTYCLEPHRSDIKFIAFEVYSGSGEDYQKHGVYPSLDKALAKAKYHGTIHKHELTSKQDLEDVIEDNLTDEQAAEYAVKS